MTEHTMICVKHGQNGLRFIQEALTHIEDEHRLTIYLFDNMACEEDHEHRIVGMSLFQKLAEKHSADLLISDGRALTTAKRLAETAKEIGATHIIIGEYSEGLWRKFLGRSTADHLTDHLPSTQVKIIPPDHAHEDAEWTFEKGMDAYLYPNNDGTYLLDFHHDTDASHEGVFFKHRHTDFNNGRFAFYDENDICEANVKKGIVHELTDHFEHFA
ncbi:hypothetical protein ACE1TF_05560 [Geomicrobium sp. JSM 1781026]|uniref:hypothetical protein n=1 Tax=Geomicrobium sp. JSM 1781026 TaxID=3344580 RepID=UPI0035C26B3D